MSILLSLFYVLSFLLLLPTYLYSKSLPLFCLTSLASLSLSLFIFLYLSLSLSLSLTFPLSAQSVQKKGRHLNICSWEWFERYFAKKTIKMVENGIVRNGKKAAQLLLHPTPSFSFKVFHVFLPEIYSNKRMKSVPMQHMKRRAHFNSGFFTRFRSSLFRCIRTSGLCRSLKTSSCC